MSPPMLLSLDDAAQSLGLSRRALSQSVSALNLKTQRGTDRRAYLAVSDVERIQAFRAGETKNNPMYQGSITYINAPQPQMMPRNYKSYIKEGYKSDPTLYKSVNYIITNGAAIPPLLYTDATMKKTIDTHPLLDLLETPNNEQSGVDYREAVIGYLLIAGNSFQFASRVTRKNGPPDELWTLPPDLVHPVLERPRGISGYNFDNFQEKDNPIPPENIRHDKFWGGDDPIWGISPVEPAAIMIDMNLASRKWNLSVLQNGGRMDGAWVVPTPMGLNERNQTEQKIHGKYRGYSNAGKAPVMDAGMTFVPTAYTPTELDWLESVRRNEGGIANTVNIPPQLIGDTSATTYNNMGEAKAASYTEEIFPVLDRIYAGWRRWLVPMYPDLKSAYLYYDKETVEVVQQVIQAQKAAQADRAVKAYLAGIIMLDQANVLMGLPPLPKGQGKVYRMGAVLIPADEIMKYAEQSMTTPAAPPMPVPEPIPTTLPPGTQPAAPTQEQPSSQPGKKPTNEATPPEQEKEPSAQQGRGKQPVKASPSLGEVRSFGREPGPAHRERETVHHSRKQADTITHLLWECDAGACAFCLENDGILIAVDDSFPNGCSGPDDSHRWCKCQAYELSIPDDTEDSTISRMSIAALAAAFGVGLIASRHDQDVQEQEQEDVQEDEDDGEKAAVAAYLASKQAQEIPDETPEQHMIPGLVSLYDRDKKAYKALLRGKTA